jgi:hypothetical protein
MPSLLLLVAGSALAIDGLGHGTYSRGISWPRLLGAGLLLATACCLLTKAVIWLCFLLIPLGLSALRRDESDKGHRYLVALAALAAGLAVPVIIQTAWILLANDWSAFWYHNVTVNRAMTGSVLKSYAGILNAGSFLFSFPMVSAPVAVLGFAHLLTADSSASRVRRQIVLLILVSCIVLILFGNGPWVQYQIPLVLVTCGLSGLGMAQALPLCPPRGRLVALSVLAGIVLLWSYVLMVCKTGNPESQFAATIKPLQAMLDAARPGDTFVGSGNRNPVFMMDADPKLFNKLMCSPDERTAEQVFDMIHARRPLFVLGFGTPIWGPEGTFVTMRPDERFQQTYSLSNPRWAIYQRRDR